MTCRNEVLLNRYLRAVAVWLPSGQRNDITAELAEDLRSAIDDGETALGRNLQEDELAEILKRRGHPLAVAGRYSPQQYLIGPAWFPIYRFLVKLVVLWIQLPLFAFIVGPLNAIASANPAASVLQTAGTYITAAVVAFAVITLVFASLERYRGKISHHWDPRRLSRFTIPQAILDSDPKRSAQGVAQAVSSLVFLLGWQYLFQRWNTFPFGVIGTRLHPILQATYWPLMLSLLAGIARGVATVLFPSRTTLRASIRIANALFSLAVAFLLLKLKAIQQIAAPFLSASNLSDPWVNIGLQLPLLIAAAIVADEGRELLQLKRTSPHPAWTLKPVQGT